MFLQHSRQVTYKNHTNRMQVKPLWFLLFFNHVMLFLRIFILGMVANYGNKARSCGNPDIHMSQFEYERAKLREWFNVLYLVWLDNLVFPVLSLSVLHSEQHHSHLLTQDSQQNRKPYNIQPFLHIWSKRTNTLMHPNRYPRTCTHKHTCTKVHPLRRDVATGYETFEDHIWYVAWMANEHNTASVSTYSEQLLVQVQRLNTWLLLMH